MPDLLHRIVNQLGEGVAVSSLFAVTAALLMKGINTVQVYIRETSKRKYALPSARKL